MMDLELAARHVRANCVMMAFNAHESHLSSALSCVEILLALYGSEMNVKLPGSPDFELRDRFFMSKGHGVAALYAVMAEIGLISKEELKSYGVTDSRLPDHPCRRVFPLLELSAGSLGHGLGVAAGMLLGNRLKKRNEARAFVLLGDGETNEGSIWEAAMFAAAQKLDRLVAVVDHNNTQAVGRNDVLTGYASIAEKFRAFGWNVFSCDGNSIPSLLETLKKVPEESGKPTAIVAETTSGKGVSFMENDQVWFYRTPRENEVEAAWQELGFPCVRGEMI